jgi:hypothetical protein
MPSRFQSKMNKPKGLHLLHISFTNPTMNFSTATTLIYTTRAGITAAAVTILTFQLALDKGLKLF